MQLNIPKKNKGKPRKSQIISFRVTYAELKLWKEICVENEISPPHLFRLMLRDLIDKYGGNDYDSSFLDELMSYKNKNKKDSMVFETKIKEKS